IMLKAIRNILMNDGYDVITAKDGREAFDKLDNEEYDVVMTDLMMPYANGLEVVSKLRSDSSKRHIGIMLCSSIGNEETITEAYRLGADDFMKKPIMTGELMRRIKKLLANSNSEMQLVTKKK